ncbi:DUF4058 family protein [Singulisphaera sp. GP187]|uniref:DUF4058 family protein n=1 Tax=Singulisphaera sp. GP187 TaxID=1882752 RepID=UPI0011612C20
MRTTHRTSFSWVGLSGVSCNAIAIPGYGSVPWDPRRWPDVHHRIISIASEILGSLLRPKYLVRIEERVYISDETDPGRSGNIPEILIGMRPGGDARPWETGGDIAVDVAEPIVATTLFAEDIHEARLEIIDRERRHLVTVIEVVSPSNKVSGSQGRLSFDRKRREVLNSPSHWVEIDLLRGGPPQPIRKIIQPCECMVHISRQESRPKGLLWPIRLSQRLSKVTIPLHAGDPDVPLDLQAVLDVAYERANYDLEIDYRTEPIPPLDREWDEWSQRLLQERGLRQPKDSVQFYCMFMCKLTTARSRARKPLATRSHGPPWE